MILVGNKKDLEEKRKVSYKEGEQLAEEYGMMFIECSAKTKENIAKVFENVAKVILQKVVNLEIDVKNEVANNNLTII